MDTVFLNNATYVGIDSHPTTHTALAINRFEDEKGHITFDNSMDGINGFLSWLPTIDQQIGNVILGIEGGDGTRHILLSSLLEKDYAVYEVNPLYTKQRRTFGTRRDKSDGKDAKLIAEVLTKKLGELPKIQQIQVATNILVLRKTVWFYEDITAQGARMKSQLKTIQREEDLVRTKEEKKLLSGIEKNMTRELAHIKKEQKQLEKQLVVFLKQYGGNLTSIPGINTILAAKLVAHSGDIKRFHSIDGYVRYAGVAPKEKSSGRNNRFVKDKQTGNRKLSTTLWIAALNQIQWNKQMKDYYHKKISEGKTKKRALVSVMKQTACIIYGMLKSGEIYRG